MTPEQKLWQSVLFQAVKDATSNTPSIEKDQADFWLSRDSKDFRQVCNLAGLDPNFIREAYVAGRINPELLRSAGR